jgi:hypothetical protein
MTSATTWPPPGWERHTFDDLGRERVYYVIESLRVDAPSVLLLHEFPGMSLDYLVPFALKIGTRFRVVLPSVIGRDGSATVLDSARTLCIRREIHVIASDGVSRAAAWVRGVVERDGLGGPGRPYGVIGMCLTGNFALALAVDERVRAAVVAQPVLPLCRASAGLSAADRNGLQRRRDLVVRGYRFHGDMLSPPWKLRGARAAVPDSPFREFRLAPPRRFAHATLTDPQTPRDVVPELLDFLTERLG